MDGVHSLAKSVPDRSDGRKLLDRDVMTAASLEEVARLLGCVECFNI